MLTLAGIRHQRGVTLIEVLITIVILAFGLLGLAGMQNRAQQMQYEGYQRAQAVLLLSEISDRISANRANAPSYVTTGTVGTGDPPVSSCATVAVGAARDICEWSNALKGASETLGTSGVGAMIGARGCITQIQAPDPTAGICKPGIYRATVAWQGLFATVAPPITCGQGASYGSDDKFRRAISSQLIISLPQCS